MRPKYILYAGVNGAGKSTLYDINGNLEGLHYINLDDAIKRLGDWRDVSINLVAGKQVVNTIKQYIEAKDSFIQETTFCGNSIIRNINNAIKQGYYIEVHYVAVETNAPEWYNKYIYLGNSITLLKRSAQKIVRMNISL